MKRHSPDLDWTYRPEIECADGTTLSVQASTVHYSMPRENDGPYTHVEVGFPSVMPPWWNSYAEDKDITETVAPFVPVGLVREFIDDHGGSDNNWLDHV